VYQPVHYHLPHKMTFCPKQSKPKPGMDKASKVAGAANFPESKGTLLPDELRCARAALS
jgi:hypothetical protein